MWRDEGKNTKNRDTRKKKKKDQIDAKREGRHRSFLFEDPDPNFKLEKISDRERKNPTRVKATKK